MQPSGLAYSQPATHARKALVFTASVLLQMQMQVRPLARDVPVWASALSTMAQSCLSGSLQKAMWCQAVKMGLSNCGSYPRSQTAAPI